MVKKKEKILAYCEYCEEEIYLYPYQVGATQNNYCSRSCQNKDMWNKHRNKIQESRKEYYQSKKTGYYINCLNCGNKFWNIPSKPNRKYCSDDCVKANIIKNEKNTVQLYHKYKHIGIVSDITGIERKTISRYLKNNNIKKYKRRVREEMRENLGNGMRGKHISDYPSHKEAMKKLRGKNHPNYKPKIECYCNWCGKKLFRHKSQIKTVRHINCGSKECKIAQRQFYSKDNSPHWQGGKTKETTLIRNSLKYKKFVRSILERDRFTCQDCGQYGGELQVHHIKSFANHPELRFEENNCVTLCKECHKNTNNYLWKAKETRCIKCHS